MEQGGDSLAAQIRAAKLRAKKPNLPPSGPRQLIPVKTETKPFTDHSGQKGISVYQGQTPSPGAPILPPLWSFQYYVTYGATADSDPGLPEQLLLASLRPLSEGYPIRLDVNFLPDADSEKCMQHYRAEKVARENAGAPLLLNDPYGESGVHFSFLVMIEHEDWEGKGGTTVIFDDDHPDDSMGVILRSGLEWGNMHRNRVVHDKPFVAETLHSLRYETPSWDSGNEKYDERLEQGRSDWD
jgi:hypothetical protein